LESFVKQNDQLIMYTQHCQCTLCKTELHNYNQSIGLIQLAAWLSGKGVGL